MRDRLSFDTWRTIHALTTVEQVPLRTTFDSAATRSYLDALVRRAAALSGLSAENMTRGSNWLFLDIGRRIERAVHAAWLVRQMLGSQDDDVEYIQYALEIADSAMTYRYRYLNVFQVPPAIDLLLLDPTNPRSAAFQIATILQHVSEAAQESRRSSARTLPGVMANEARDLITYTDPFELARCDERGKRVALDVLATAIEASMPKLSDAIADAYFQHTTLRRTRARRETS